MLKVDYWGNQSSTVDYTTCSRTPLSLRKSHKIAALFYKLISTYFPPQCSLPWQRLLAFESLATIRLPACLLIVQGKQMQQYKRV